jgi:hypothetical protein
MRRRTFIALLVGVLLAGGALLTTASFAQGIGRWIISTPMPSSRTFRAELGRRAAKARCLRCEISDLEVAATPMPIPELRRRRAPARSSG